MMKSLIKKNIIRQIQIASLVGFYFFLADYIFIKSFYSQIYPRGFTLLFETILLFILFSISFPLVGFLSLIFLLGLLTFIQMAHLTYFGVFIHPTKIYLFFTQYDEVFETLLTLRRQMFWPLMFLLTMVIVLVLVQKYYPRQIWRVKYFHYLVIFAIVYSPMRSYINGNTYGRQPSVQNIGFSNLYASLSYFVAVTLPEKLNKKKSGEANSVQYVVENIQPQKNIIIIMGESLRYQNMSIYGYKIQNTPFLEKMKSLEQLQLWPAISGGVSTDVSLPMFFNNTSGLKALPSILSQQGCLFKLAQQNGFETYFVSAQSKKSVRHILNYLCPQYIDHMSVYEEDTDENNYNSEDERDEIKEEELQDYSLIESVSQFNQDKPKFIVLLQRGSHSPYEYRYPTEWQISKVSKNDDPSQNTIKHYDNSIHYSDYILSKLDEVLKKQKLKNIIIFTADHGEALGEQGKWGHGFYDLPEVYSVPFIVWPINNISKSDIEKFNSLSQKITHQQITNWIVELLGYKIKADTTSHSIVMGSDIEGQDGYLPIQ